MTGTVQTWIRRVTAVALVVVAAAVIVVAGRRMRGARPRLLRLLPRATEAGAGADDRPIGVTSGFEHLESLAGEPVFLLRAARVLGLESGWYRLEGDVTLRLYRTGIGAATIRCDAARFHARRRDAEMEGSVHVEFTGGEFVDAPAGRFDARARRFVSEGEVFFGGPGYVGRAPEVVYDLGDERLTLPRGLEVLGDGGASLTAPRAVYHRARYEVDLPEGLAAVLPSGGIEAPRGTIRLEPGTRRVVGIELVDGVHFGASATGTRGPMRGRAGRLKLHRAGPRQWQGVAEGGADGWVLLEALDGPGYAMRRIRTWTLRFSAASDRLLSAVMDGQVCVEEVPEAGPVQRGSATRGLVHFAADGAPEDLELEEDVRLASGGWRAEGARARFVAAEGTALLQGDPERPGSRAHVTGDGPEIWADEVRLEDRRGVLVALGDVQGSSRDLALLRGEEQEPVRFACTRFEGSEGGDLLVLRRDARVWQGRRLLLAETIRANRRERWLEAEGGVRLTAPGEDGSGEMLVVARTMRYDESTGRAVFQGAVRLSDPTAILTAASLEVRVGERGEIEGFEARQGVVVEDIREGRRLRGEVARYDAESSTLLVTGTPATLVDPRGNVVSGSSLTWNRAGGTVTVAGGEGSPTETIYHPEEGGG